MITKNIRVSLHRSELGELEGVSPSIANEDDALARFCRIVWSRIVEPGDGVANRLIKNYGVKEALEIFLNRQIVDLDDVGEKDLKKAFLRWEPRIDREASFTDIQRAQKNKIQILTPEEPLWPEQLEDLDHNSPVMLWTRGKQEFLKMPSLAIVGARAASSYGEHVTGEFTDLAVNLGLSIVSGAAYGIDAVAHRTVLARSGTTVAVLAGGADRFYPAGHSELLRKISETGLVCSELVPGMPPTRWRFLMRNRLIAALSVATLVTEAGKYSGSLNTAGHAAQLGRGLGAVPGPITSVTSLGTHRLLKEYDATLVTDEADLKQLLGFSLEADAFSGAEQRLDPTGMHRRIKDAIPLNSAVSVQAIARNAGVSLHDAQVVLAELELLRAVQKTVDPQTNESRWQFFKTR